MLHSATSKMIISIGGIITNDLTLYHFDKPPPLFSACRLMLVFPVIPGLIQLLGFLFMPESPRWLVERGRDDQALKVLTSINGGDDDAAKIAVFELEDIKATHDETVRVRREAGILYFYKIFTLLIISHVITLKL